MSSTEGKFKNENQNFAASDKWRCVVGDLVLFSRRIHDFSVPGVYSEGIDGPSPGDVMAQIPSERLTFDPVVFTFVVDEDWRNWESLFSWLVNNANADLIREQDIYIELLTNLNRPTGLKLLLQDSRPTALDNVMLDVDGEVPQLVCTVTFKFQKLIPQRATTTL